MYTHVPISGLKDVCVANVCREWGRMGMNNKATGEGRGGGWGVEKAHKGGCGGGESGRKIVTIQTPNFPIMETCVATHTLHTTTPPPTHSAFQGHTTQHYTHTHTLATHSGLVYNTCTTTLSTLSAKPLWFHFSHRAEWEGRE